MSLHISLIIGSWVWTFSIGFTRSPDLEEVRVWGTLDDSGTFIPDGVAIEDSE